MQTVESRGGYSPENGIQICATHKTPFHALLTIPQDPHFRTFYFIKILKLQSFGKFALQASKSWKSTVPKPYIESKKDSSKATFCSEIQFSKIAVVCSVSLSVWQNESWVSPHRIFEGHIDSNEPVHVLAQGNKLQYNNAQLVSCHTVNLLSLIPGGYSDLSWTGVCRSSLKTHTHL